MSLETRVCAVRENKLLQRKEVELVIEHAKKSSPSKEEISSQISTLFRARKEMIVVYGCETRFGTNETRCRVKVYDSLATLKAVEKKSVVKEKTGIDTAGKPRRARKDERKKKAKIFGTMKRHIRKAEKRAQK